VAVEDGFLLRRKLLLRINVGSALDMVLVERHPQVVALLLSVPKRDQRLAQPEEAGGHRRPFRALAVGVEVDLLELADLLSVLVDDRAPAPAHDRVDVRHLATPPGRRRALVA
jgi:hypothetical protein